MHRVSANSNDRVVAVAFGAEDFSAAIGICRSSDDTGLLYARSAVIVAARSGYKEVYDSPSMDFRDQNAVKTAAQRARDLGFSGQLTIHPMQVPIVNQVFYPSLEEIAKAKQLIDNFDQQGCGVIQIDGKLVDEPTLKRARRILALART